MSVITLEEKMVCAHKIGVMVYRQYADNAAPYLERMMDETQVFQTEAERMAFLAGYHGAKRRHNNGRLQ